MKIARNYLSSLLSQGLKSTPNTKWIYFTVFWAHDHLLTRLPMVCRPTYFMVWKDLKKSQTTLYKIKKKLPTAWDRNLGDKNNSVSSAQEIWLYL